MFRLRLTCGLTVLLTLALLPISRTCGATDFDDVPEGFWASAAIHHIVDDLHIMEGCGGDFFCPFGLVTRADMAVWLERVHHYTDPNFTPPSPAPDFADVPVETCRAGWIWGLYDDGITIGCKQIPERQYCPRKIMSRAEMAVYLVRVIDGAEPDPENCTGIFNDVPCGHDWPRGATIEKLYELHVTGGCSDNPLKYCPYGGVTRAQMALFLTRVMCNLYCKDKDHSETCWGLNCEGPNAPQTDWEVPVVTMDSSDDGHELVEQ